MKLPSYKNFFLKVNRKGIYFIWMRVKIRKAELIEKHCDKVSSSEYVGMFHNAGIELSNSRLQITNHFLYVPNQTQHLFNFFMNHT